jgi:hypothetical protein
MTTGSTDTGQTGPVTGNPEPPTPLPVRIRAATRQVRARPRQRKAHGPVGYFLLGVSAVYAGYTGWWALHLLHGHARILTAGGASVAYLLGSALFRRGWLG